MSPKVSETAEAIEVKARKIVAALRLVAKASTAAAGWVAVGFMGFESFKKLIPDSYPERIAGDEENTRLTSGYIMSMLKDKPVGETVSFGGREFKVRIGNKERDQYKNGKPDHIVVLLMHDVPLFKELTR